MRTQDGGQGFKIPINFGTHRDGIFKDVYNAGWMDAMAVVTSW
jgi:hypothetical protein